MRNYEQFYERAAKIRQEYAALLSTRQVTVNDILIEDYKAETGADVFKTFKRWKEEGYKVKKGEHGFIVFSKPVTKGNKKDEDQGDEETKQEKGGKKFYICYLFNEKQVESIN